MKMLWFRFFSENSKIGSVPISSISQRQFFISIQIRCVSNIIICDNVAIESEMIWEIVAEPFLINRYRFVWFWQCFEWPKKKKNLFVLVVKKAFVFAQLSDKSHRERDNASCASPAKDLSVSVAADTPKSLHKIYKNVCWRRCVGVRVRLSSHTLVASCAIYRMPFN